LQGRYRQLRSPEGLVTGKIQAAPFFRGVGYREDTDSSVLQRGKLQGGYRQLSSAEG